MVQADGAVLYLQQNPPFVRITPGTPSPTITFTGILARSPNLTDWEDLTVTSPYTPPARSRPSSSSAPTVEGKSGEVRPPCPEIRPNFLLRPQSRNASFRPRRKADLNASVAQLVEQKTLNLLVLGSNPSRGTSFFRNTRRTPAGVSFSRSRGMQFPREKTIPAAVSRRCPSLP